jgi:hypothetical protein
MRHATWLIAASVLLCFAGPAPSVRAQQQPQGQPIGEVVANLAAGRVVIAVVRGGIVIAALENRIEPSTRPPQIVPLAGRRAGILLGAVQWMNLTSGEELARLSNELPSLRSTANGGGPSLQPGGPQVSSEIEVVGLGVLERLRAVAENLHGELHLAPEEPLVELVLVGYDPEYGAEAWLLRYSITQRALSDDFWQTTVMRPSYTRLWPPEKGQPKDLVEVRYPPEDAGPSVEEMLRADDKRLAAARATDAANRKAATLFANGESLKASVKDATQFLRAAFAGIAPPNAGEAIAVLDYETGFNWIVQPPPEKKPRQSGAPTLQKPL